MSDYLTYIIIAIILITTVVLISYLITCYNDLVAVKNNVAKSWSNIDVLLKQRHDELTKLIDLCKQYMEYEPKTYNNIINAREGIKSAYQKNDAQSLAENEKNLQSSLKNLLALAENYPALQANQTFKQIADAIHMLETRIAERRELFNESVNISNTLIEQFPTNIISILFNFKHFELIKLSPAETSDVNIVQLFKS
jgi:LemA protein